LESTIQGLFQGQGFTPPAPLAKGGERVRKVLGGETIRKVLGGDTIRKVLGGDTIRKVLARQVTRNAETAG
jgi:hypothetical protein